MSAPNSAPKLSATADYTGRSGGQYSPLQRTMPPLIVRQGGLIVTKTPLIQSGRVDTSNMPVGCEACRHTQAAPAFHPEELAAPLAAVRSLPRFSPLDLTRERASSARSLPPIDIAIEA